MRTSSFAKSWLAVALGLGICPNIGQLAAQTAPPSTNRELDEAAIVNSITNTISLSITITGPENGHVDQPIAFQVKIVNDSKLPTPRAEFCVAPLAQEQELVTLRVGALNPGESRLMSVSLVSRRAGPFAVVAWFGKQPSPLLDAIAYVRRSTTEVQVTFDPATPTSKFLPAMPKARPTTLRLPSTLEQVPEVSLEDPLDRAMTAGQVRDHVAGLIDRIKYVGQGKPDDYVLGLVKERADLAGLPFAMGDACRITGASRRAFGDTMDRLRKARRESFATTEIISRMSGARTKLAKKEMEIADRADIATVVQVLAPEVEEAGSHLVNYLSPKRVAESTRALAKLAIFSEDVNVRKAAMNALKDRPTADATDILVQGLGYPWPEVAERAASAIATLKRTDLIPQLRDALKRPDPRASVVRVVDGKKVHVIREVVRINHHRNCLLCHATAGVPTVKDLQDDGGNLAAALTARVVLPNAPFPVDYYGDQSPTPDILVRIDVTYLRQDFSMMMPVADAAPWPQRQRFDFLVRTRELPAEEAHAYDELLRFRLGLSVLSRYQVAAKTALSTLGAN